METILFNNKLQKLIKINKRSSTRPSGVIAYLEDQNPIIKILHDVKICDECGDNVIDRREEIYVTGFGKQNPHWVKSCLNCKKKTKLGKYIKK